MCGGALVMLTPVLDALLEGPIWGPRGLFGDLTCVTKGVLITYKVQKNLIVGRRLLAFDLTQSLLIPS